MTIELIFLGMAIWPLNL